MMAESTCEGEKSEKSDDELGEMKEGMGKKDGT
jgi:hypothetical protein